MYILGIDTSTKYLSAAITNGTRELVSFHKDIDVKHSSLLIPTIDKLLKKSKLSLKDINVIALSIGPGSFTGLRIAVAAVKAFRLVYKTKIVAIPTMDAIAYNYNMLAQDLAVVLDAKKNRVYAAFYKKENGIFVRKTDNMLTDLDSVLDAVKPPITFAGDGAEVYKDEILKKMKKCANIITDESWHPDAVNVCRLAVGKIKNKEFVSAGSLEPLYLYPKECNVRGFKF